VPPPKKAFADEPRETYSGPMKVADLALFLKDSRVRCGLSQGDVAKQLGYTTPQYVSNWERGLATPSSRVLYKLAALYQVSADELYEILLRQVLERTERELRKDFLDACRPPRRAGARK